ncbi:MAG: type II secretion system protein GspG [Nitrospinota bacterium]
MSRRKDTAKAAVQAQLQSLIALLRLYKEEFSKTPEDRERLEELVERAEALEARYNELTAPRASRR